MAQTRVAAFPCQTEWLLNQKKDDQSYPVKGGRRSTGEKSPGGTREKVGVSHHQAWKLDCCEDLGGTQLQAEEEAQGQPWDSWRWMHGTMEEFSQ